MKKVTVTTTRYYSKTATIEVETELTGEELVNYLITDEIDYELDEAIGNASLEPETETYEYYDNENKIGGHF